jgi:orotate phosphoribosyltransferase-like protein
MLLEISAQIVALNNDGRSVRYIAQHLNIARSTVQDTLSRFRKTYHLPEGPDLAVDGQQMPGMTVFSISLCCEIGDCQQIFLLDD